MSDEQLMFLLQNLMTLIIPLLIAQGVAVERNEMS